MSNDADMWLDWSEKWFNIDGNPLHVWRALDFCLNSQPTREIPAWCRPYLAKAASNLNSLASGWDFGNEHKRLSPQQAFDRSREAMCLARQGKKNAFIEIQEAGRLGKHALDAEMGHDAVAAIMKERSVEADRAKRLLEKGRKLSRLR